MTLKRTHGLVLCLGGILLLLAIVLSTRTHTTHATEDSHLRLRLSDAVAQLDQCLTCHTETTTGAILVHQRVLLPAQSDEQSSRAPHMLVASALQAPFDDVKAQLDTELYDVGQSLLDLPSLPHDDYQNAYTATVTAVLDIYNATRNNETPDTLLDALQALQTIKQQIISLEHQAQPIQWTDSSQLPEAETHYVLNTTTTSSHLLVADLESESLLLIKSDGYLPVERTLMDWPQSVVFTTRHRGPPANMGVESVLLGRDCQNSLRNLFSFVKWANHRGDAVILESPILKA